MALPPPPPTAVPEPVPAPPRERRARRFLPVAVVFGVLCVVVLGGYVVAGALSQPAGPPVSVAGAVRVSPLSGWQLAERFASPPGARLTRGSGNLDVIATPFQGGATDLARVYVSRVLGSHAERLKVSATFDPVRLDSGLSGVRISYVGVFQGVQSPIEGQVTAVVARAGFGVVFDGWAPQGLLEYSLGDIDAMVNSAVIG